MHLRHCAAALLLAGGAAVAADVATVNLGPISVTPPAGEGWQVVKRDEQVVAFQRIDQVAKFQSTAYVARMAFKAPASDLAGVEAELRQAIAFALPQLELATQGVTYKGSQSRDYACVTAQAEATQKVPMPSGEPVSLAVTMVIKGCRLTGPDAVGYMVGYSHSAFQRYAQTAQDAEAFFKGVNYSLVTQVLPMPSTYSGTGKGVLRANSCPQPAYPQPA